MARESYFSLFVDESKLFLYTSREKEREAIFTTRYNYVIKRKKKKNVILI